MFFQSDNLAIIGHQEYSVIHAPYFDKFFVWELNVWHLFQKGQRQNLQPIVFNIGDMIHKILSDFDGRKG